MISRLKNSLWSWFDTYKLNSYSGPEICGLKVYDKVTDDVLLDLFKDAAVDTIQSWSVPRFIDKFKYIIIDLAKEDKEFSDKFFKALIISFASLSETPDIFIQRDISDSINSFDVAFPMMKIAYHFKNTTTSSQKLKIQILSAAKTKSLEHLIPELRQRRLNLTDYNEVCDLLDKSNDDLVLLYVLAYSQRPVDFMLFNRKTQSASPRHIKNFTFASIDADNFSMFTYLLAKDSVSDVDRIQIMERAINCKRKNMITHIENTYDMQMKDLSIKTKEGYSTVSVKPKLTNRDALLLAIDENQKGIIKHYCSDGILPWENEDYSVIKDLCKNKKLDMVKFLITDCGLNPAFEKNFLFNYAIGTGAWTFVLFLLGLGINCAQSDAIQSIIKPAEREGFDIHYILREAILNGDFSNARVLISIGADPKASNCAILRQVAGKGSMDTLKFLVEELKLDPGVNSGTAISSASYSAQHESVRYLLSCCKDKNPGLSNLKSGYTTFGIYKLKTSYIFSVPDGASLC